MLRFVIVFIVFSKLIYNGAVYQLFPALNCKHFKLEIPFMEKLNTKRHNEK